MVSRPNEISVTQLQPTNNPGADNDYEPNTYFELPLKTRAAEMESWDGKSLNFLTHAGMARVSLRKLWL